MKTPAEDNNSYLEWWQILIFSSDLKQLFHENTLQIVHSLFSLSMFAYPLLTHCVTIIAANRSLLLVVFQ